MIKSLVVENFRGFRRAEVELGSLTALVGPNASGKTSLLTALDPQFVPGEPDKWRRDASLTCSIILEPEKGPPWERRRPGRVRASHSFPYGFQLLHLDVRSLRQQVQLSRARKLDVHGENLPNVLATMGRASLETLAAELCDLVPVYSDFDLVPGRSHGHHELRFYDRWDRSVTYSPDQVSDGTLFVLALLTIRHQLEKVDVVAIEEPEHGLHPYLLGRIVDILRDLSQRSPRALQVVLATQSPELLDHLEPHEVRILSRRNEDGSIEVHPVATDSPNWKHAFAAYDDSLGGLWLSGNLGGVPGRADRA